MIKYYSDARLLERVTYLSRRESKTKNIFGEEIVVHATFPYNTDSKTAPSTAKTWATQRTYNYAERKYEDDEFVPTPVDLTNEPFEVTIIDLQVRSQGGRAYKVVDSEMRLFDLREDQLLEALKIGGVQPGGKINGKFVWGVLGSQVRMVYVDGEQHKSMVKQLETNKERDLAKANGQGPKASTFTVGHVYKKRDDSLHVFVGRVRTADSKKKLFAFADLPTPPHRHTDETIDGYVTQYGYKEDSEFIQGLRSDAVAADKWATMTWRERCEWTWSRNRYYRDYVTLMSTPKFDSDEGDGAQDVADIFRTNVDDKFQYVDGLGNDLSAARWQKKNGVDPNYQDYQSYWYLSEVQKKERENQRQERIKAAFDEFKAELVWD